MGTSSKTMHVIGQKEGISPGIVISLGADLSAISVRKRSRE